MGWYPRTEVFRGPRLIVEDAFAAAKRYEAGQFEDEPDTREGITAATPDCQNGASCRFLTWGTCRYSHGRNGYEIYWGVRDDYLKRIRSSPGAGAIADDGRKNTERTRLLGKVEAVVKEGERGVDSVRVYGDPEGEEIWLHVPHAALAAVLAAPAAAPPPALTEAAALAKLRPLLDRVSGCFDKNIDDYGDSDERGRPQPARRPLRRHPLVLRQRDAFRNSSGSTRPMSLVDRVARMQLDYDALYQMEDDFQHNEIPGGASDDDCGEQRWERREREAVDMEGRRLLHARIALQDALDDARQWLDEVTGKSVSPLAALLTLLREAYAAGQDVLVYHSVS
jgi:hypothetical protein